MAICLRHTRRRRRFHFSVRLCRNGTISYNYIWCVCVFFTFFRYFVYIMRHGYLQQVYTHVDNSFIVVMYIKCVEGGLPRNRLLTRFYWKIFLWGKVIFFVVCIYVYIRICLVFLFLRIYNRAIEKYTIPTLWICLKLSARRNIDFGFYFVLRHAAKINLTHKIIIFNSQEIKEHHRRHDFESTTHLSAYIYIIW